MPETVPNQYTHLPSDYHTPGQFHRPDTVDHKLYIITPVFNPQRYRSRWKLYLDFEKKILQSGEAHLVTIECAFGNRAFALTQKDTNHTLIQVRTKDEIWIKENLLNLAIQRIPQDAKYLAWIDGDVDFARPDIIGETIQKLQHYSVVQMFSTAHDLDSNYDVIKTHKGFFWSYLNSADGSVPPNQGRIKMPTDSYGTNPFGSGISYWHPGFATAWRREAFDAVGGFIDWGILGGGDTFMAYALIGVLDQRTMPNSLGEVGVKWLREWQERAEKYIKRNVGFVSGTLYHHWHGPRKSRGYFDRGTILTNAKFTPEIDIKRDWQGLWQLNPENTSLRDGARKYFSMRNEDQISE